MIASNAAIATAHAAGAAAAVAMTEIAANVAAMMEIAATAAAVSNRKRARLLHRQSQYVRAARAPRPGAATAVVANGMVIVAKVAVVTAPKAAIVVAAN